MGRTMAHVKVYQFDYFDGLLKHDRRSADYATADAISETRGKILAETERTVDEDLLDERGFIKPAALPPREAYEGVTPERWRPARTNTRGPAQPRGR